MTQAFKIALPERGLALLRKTPFEPMEKKHLLAFAMFCSIQIFGERFGVHQNPRHLHDSEGFRCKGKVVDESGTLFEDEDTRSSHLGVFSFR